MLNNRDRTLHTDDSALVRSVCGINYVFRDMITNSRGLLLGNYICTYKEKKN